MSLIVAAIGGIMLFSVMPSFDVAGTLVNWDIVAYALLTAGAVGALASVWMEAAASRAAATPRGRPRA